MKSKKMTAGFTLVELIVVIAILGILAGVGTVGYSGYIKKANEAADQQLLGYLNQAFAAACLDEGGKDVHSVTSANVIWSGKKVTGVDIYNDAFLKYYGESVNSEFKVIEGLIFDSGLHQFVDTASEAITLTYNGNPIVISGAALTALVNSTFGEMGAETLLGQVGFASAVANALMGNDTSSLHNVLTTENLAALMDYNFSDPTQEAEFYTMYGTMVQSLVEDTDSVYYGDQEGAERYILANSAVLSVAKAATTINTSDISDLLASGSLASTLSSDMDDPAKAQTALAQAALAYGMYTSYMYDKDGSSPNITNLAGLTAVLNDTGFKSYIDSDEGQADLDAYIAALGVVNSGIEQGAATSVLTDGYNNEELLNLLTQAMGK